MNSALGWIVAALMVVGATLVIGLIFSLPVMWLWNWALVPALPVVKPIGWLQAWGLLVLSSLLFKNTSNSSNDTK